MSVGLKEELLRYCLIQEMQLMTSFDGETLLNQFDCPLLTLTNRIFAVHPDCILTTVSVVHQCNSSCVFVEKPCISNVERECVSQKSLVYQHDWSNDMYCLNIFCTNQ